MKIHRGDIFYADFGSVAVGSEQAGLRPVVIIQNDIGNHFSPTVIVASITSVLSKASLPTHVKIDLIKPSMVLFEQIRTIDKSRLREKIGFVPDSLLDEFNKSLAISVGLREC